MHAYLLTEDEAFRAFSDDARAAILARCECERDVGYKCDECRHVDGMCARLDLDWDDWIDTKSRLMARRKMARRRVK